MMRPHTYGLILATIVSFSSFLCGLSSPLVEAVDTPWVLGDEQSVACYTLSTKEDIPKPVGLEMHWTQPPAAPLDSTAKTPVSYWARVQPNFWNHSSNVALLGADYAKYSRLCLNETGGCDASGDCCIWHSNVHSCRAESGACEPWVAATNGTDATGNEYTLVTHTAALEGGLEEWTQDLQLDNGDWIIIAHVKIMTFQCAVGATRLSATPAETSRRFPAWGIVLIAVFGTLGLVLCLYVALSAWMKGAAARRAPKQGPCTLIIVSVYKVASLWETYPDKMPEVLSQYNRTVRSLLRQHGCYEVKRIGETNFVIAAGDIEAAVNFATQLQEAVFKSSWRCLTSADDTHSAVLHPSSGAFLQDSTSGTARSESHQSRQRLRLRTKRGAAAHQDELESERDAQSTCISDSESAALGCLGKLGVTIGLQYGDVRISHDPEANTYDYNGGVVSDAAMLADLAVSGQIYAAEPVFDALPQTVGGSHFLSTLCQWKLETGQQNIYKITSRGMPDINYVPQDALAGSAQSAHGTAAEGGGVLAALDQATAGLAAKKVVVVCIRVNGSTKQVTAGARQQLIADTLALDKAVAELVVEAKGHLQACLSGDFVVTFNAASNVAHPLKRALTMLFDLQDCFEEQFPEYTVHCGISAGHALVGTLGSRTQLYTPVYRQAAALAGLCGAYGSMASTYSPAPFCLLHDGMKEDIAAFCHLQYVDAVVLPHNASSRRSGFSGVLSLVKPKPAGATDHDQDESPLSTPRRGQFKRDALTGVLSLVEPKPLEPVGGAGQDHDGEWMYELEAAAGRDPYRLTNQAWEAVLAGDMAEANEFLAKRAEAFPKAEADDDCGEEEESCPSSSSCKGGGLTSFITIGQSSRLISPSDEKCEMTNGACPAADVLSYRQLTEVVLPECLHRHTPPSEEKEGKSDDISSSLLEGLQAYTASSISPSRYPKAW